MLAMAMGKRKRDRQPPMWVATTDLPTAASHPFYRRLNQLADQPSKTWAAEGSVITAALSRLTTAAQI